MEHFNIRVLQLWPGLFFFLWNNLRLVSYSENILSWASDHFYRPWFANLDVRVSLEYCLKWTNTYRFLWHFAWFDSDVQGTCCAQENHRVWKCCTYPCCSSAEVQFEWQVRVSQPGLLFWYWFDIDIGYSLRLSYHWRVQNMLYWRSLPLGAHARPRRPKTSWCSQ